MVTYGCGEEKKGELRLCRPCQPSERTLASIAQRLTYTNKQYDRYNDADGSRAPPRQAGQVPAHHSCRCVGDTKHEAGRTRTDQRPNPRSDV